METDAVYVFLSAPSIFHSCSLFCIKFEFGTKKTKYG